jgi:hypothetical protein
MVFLFSFLINCILVGLSAVFKCFSSPGSCYIHGAAALCVPEAVGRLGPLDRNVPPPASCSVPSTPASHFSHFLDCSKLPWSGPDPVSFSKTVRIRGNFNHINSRLFDS